MEFTPDIHSKLPQVGTSIFAKMGGLAMEHNALNLSQGFPDFPIDERLMEALKTASFGGMNQYSPMPGLPKLRNAISQSMGKMYGFTPNPDTELTVVAGATEGLFSAFQAFIKEGDEVVLFTPAYDSYAPAIELAGGKPVYVQLQAPDFSIDWTEVRKVLTRKTKAIVLNSPHNPSGAVIGKKDVDELKKIVKGTDILVFSDEVYDRMVFDGKKHLCLAADPELKNRTMSFFSFGKTYHTTGWKCGFVMANEAITAELRRIHQFVVFAVNTPTQEALANYILEFGMQEDLSGFYQEKRDFFVKGLAGSNWKINPTESTYFQLLDYAAIDQRRDVDFADYLVKEKKIATIPISVFYHRPPENEFYLRVCFAKSQDTLEKAVEQLSKF